MIKYINPSTVKERLNEKPENQSEIQGNSLVEVTFKN